jgi:RNA polymerase sigma-70 factor, ECF subfamily
VPASGEEPGLEDLLAQVALGHEQAFNRVYDLLAGPVFGLARRVVRDRAQAEEVAQEVLVEVWRTASRYDRTRGSALSWVMTMAHHRSVDRVRSAQASADREEKVSRMSGEVAYDQVSEVVATRLEGPSAARLPGLRAVADGPRRRPPGGPAGADRGRRHGAGHGHPAPG